MIAARTLRRGLKAGTLLLALTTAVGCAGRQDPPSAAAATPVPTPTPGPAQVMSLHLPIEDYMLTPEQTARRGWVHGRIVEDCMKKYGLDFPVGSKPVASAADSVMYRRYGVTDPASVATWGYHLPRAKSSAVTDSAALKPSAAEQTVMFARNAERRPVTTYRGRKLPEGGCEGAAARRLGTGVGSGSGSGSDGIVAATKSDSFARSLADPRVRKVVARWSACMRTHGFDEPNPMEAGAKLPSVQRAEPDRTEIGEARADVGCKESTNLVGVWFAVESEYQNAAITGRPNEFRAARAERDAEISRITRLAHAYGA
ncbi:hypothetical protein [Streptomyces sp. NPDC093060]|uniref:hypothetical protein n=1 Tax=Streptomyces sp. NPDC093060 TaxID=3366019 RepID=UPI003817A5F6